MCGLAVLAFPSGTSHSPTSRFTSLHRASNNSDLRERVNRMMCRASLIGVACSTGKPCGGKGDCFRRKNAGPLASLADESRCHHYSGIDRHEFITIA